jgi:hypothetical protein
MFTDCVCVCVKQKRYFTGFHVSLVFIVNFEATIVIVETTVHTNILIQHCSVPAEKHAFIYRKETKQHIRML